MKNKINISIVFMLPILIMVAFSVPQLALASWWNPFSWFKKEVKIEQPIQIPVVQPEVVIVPEKNIEKEIKEETKVIPVIESKNIINETSVVKQEVKTEENNHSTTEVVKENYKLEDVVKEWRPYVVRVTCIVLDSNGNKKSYSDGSGFLTFNSAKGPTIFTNRHVFNLPDGTATNYCDVYFPDSKEVIRVDKNDRYISSKGYDKGSLLITQPSEYVSTLSKNTRFTVNDCIKANQDSTDDIVIMGYPMGKPKDDISYSQGKIVGYKDRYFISTTTIISGYSGGVTVSLKDNCYLGIPTYSQKEDSSKSLILDINKF
jgi:hypothetical protein